MRRYRIDVRYYVEAEDSNGAMEKIRDGEEPFAVCTVPLDEHGKQIIKEMIVRTKEA